MGALMRKQPRFVKQSQRLLAWQDTMTLVFGMVSSSPLVLVIVLLPPPLLTSAIILMPLRSKQNKH
jgi:hypothetical protein